MNVEENIANLKKEFLRIKRMEYVKSVRNGPTGVGATFEKLLGKEEESFEIPDYNGIEIKTKRSYSKAYISLFNAVPTGSGFNECKRLRDKYGYPSKKDKNLKCLYCELFSKDLLKVGLWYYFKIRVNKKEERIYLEIYDHRKILIDNFTYWDFDILKEKLERKLQILALVKAWPNRINGVEYFKYYKMNIYLLKTFEDFIKMVDEGKIKITFKMNSFTDEKRYGNLDNHGVSFSIREEDLLDLYEIYR